MKREERLDFLVQLGTKLDKLGLHKLAAKVDALLEHETDGIESIIGIYKKLHAVGASKVDKVLTAALRSDTRPDTPQCPFGLPIPTACKYAGESVQDMSTREVEHRHNRRLYNKERTHQMCPYALQLLEEQKAVRCSYGTINAKVPQWEQHRGSPLYPKLWQGFNIPDILMNRNYYTYNDFNYTSLY